MSYISIILYLSSQLDVMFFSDKDDVVNVRVLVCGNYYIFVVNIGQCFCNIRMSEYRCCLCVFLNLLIRI